MYKIASAMSEACRRSISPNRCAIDSRISGPAELGGGPFDSPARLLLDAHVGLEHERSGAALADPSRQVFEPIGPPGGDGHRGSVLGQGVRGGLADAAGGARDERDRAVEGGGHHDASQRKPASAGAGGIGLVGSPGRGSFSLNPTGARSFGVSGWNSDARYCACPRPGPSSNWPPP
jgi:hypothetical protein